nr:nucleotidyltransferase family protein [Streptomyces sp. CBG9]
MSHDPTLLTVLDRAATTCCLGIRLDPHDHWHVYAPHGLADIFNLVLRPNPVLAPR